MAWPRVQLLVSMFSMSVFMITSSALTASRLEIRLRPCMRAGSVGPAQMWKNFLW